MIGAFLSQEIERNGLMSVNKHETIYVVSPEINNGQMLFRDNNKGAIDGKHEMCIRDRVTYGAAGQYFKDSDCVSVWYA